MKSDIAATARAVLDGSARNDDARELARWVLERVAEDKIPHCEACGSFDVCEWCRDCGEVKP